MTPLDTWMKETGDQLHYENATGIHHDGFCEPCAEIYVALNKAVDYFHKVHQETP